MPDRIMLKHPSANRRRTFSPHQTHLVERYLAAGWKPDGEPPAATPEPTLHDVPNGPIPTVLDWVSNDPERARTALWVERETSRRPSLIAQLERIANDPHDGEKETDL